MIKPLVVILALAMPIPVYGLGAADSEAILRQGSGKKLIENARSGFLNREAVSRSIADFPDPTGKLEVCGDSPDGWKPGQATKILSGMGFDGIRNNKLSVSYERKPFDP